MRPLSAFAGRPGVLARIGHKADTQRQRPKSIKVFSDLPRRFESTCLRQANGVRSTDWLLEVEKARPGTHGGEIGGSAPGSAELDSGYSLGIDNPVHSWGTCLLKGLLVCVPALCPGEEPYPVPSEAVFPYPHSGPGRSRTAPGMRFKPPAMPNLSSNVGAPENSGRLPVVGSFAHPSLKKWDPLAEEVCCDG